MSWIQLALYSLQCNACWTYVYLQTETGQGGRSGRLCEVIQSGIGWTALVVSTHLVAFQNSWICRPRDQPSRVCKNKECTSNTRSSPWPSSRCGLYLYPCTFYLLHYLVLKCPYLVDSIHHHCQMTDRRSSRAGLPVCSLRTNAGCRSAQSRRDGSASGRLM